MNMKQNNQHGFTLVEVLIASTLTVLVFLSIFSVIIATQRTHNTENRRLDMNQAGRGIDQFLVEPCREAGAVLTMLNTTSFLAALPQFNGILPLYNPANLGAYPDGIMVASGDPNAITSLTGDFNAGEGTVSVITTNIKSVDVTIVRAWHAGDFGLISRADGFYVFRVNADVTSDTSLSVAALPAYRSGLLNTTHYVDPTSAGTGTYPAGSPVIRLDNFSIFLIQSKTDGSRTLVMVNDFNGANLAADLSTAPTFDDVDNRMIGPVPILPNIQDLQISYIQIDPATGVETVVPSGPAAWAAIQNKTVRSIRFEMLLRTQEATETSGSGISYRKPVMGDSTDSGQILTGRYHYHFLTREVGLRNYPIQF
ncbi:MAG: prepilin-type N-terminal cleavage/methylation domain-containing protein [Acidobacteria bacterium]|nr:prepilin-type N-terminal cleavage/methylation domain-containing protein [Acidobacteriota bacterium]MBU4307178.1 prepilin-type N-terminal cleavage/methylation domain-containing protein [Acidobacteriota bacterium]MCG2810929.1 prepilin-type N-terminal cleavage/methylation domain-containing protein [Candidatus Aminicenantes bacterium]